MIYRLPFVLGTGEDRRTERANGGAADEGM